MSKPHQLPKRPKVTPEPEFVWGQVTPNYTAYAWAMDDGYLRVLGDTRKEAIEEYERACSDEYAP